ncbi:MAG: HVO_2922 family protein [Halapricum sp.]
MSVNTEQGPLYRFYRNRIGEPDTADEVRGYWVFLIGLLLGAVGLVLFLPSESAAGVSGFTLREGSIMLLAVGLAMLVAGPVIRLPLQSWATYAAYLGQAICLAAVAWFAFVFPTEWSTLTGNQPVIFLYAAGLAIITLAGIFGSVIGGTTREALDASEQRTDELEAELEAAREERETVQSELTADLEELEALVASLHASQAQFELYEDRASEWRWRLRHRNGNVIAASGEGYTRKHNAKKGMASVRRNALGATLLEIVPEPDEEPADALETAPIIPNMTDESKATFELYEDRASEWRWRLVHDNGHIIADSGEGYTRKQKARQGIDSVKGNAGPASYLQFDPASFEIYRDKAGEWRFRLLHRNGNILAAASEGYTRRRDAKRAVDSIRGDVSEDRFDIYEDNRGETRWRWRSGNGEIVATSGEGYSSESAAEDALERVQRLAPDADALDVGLAAFEVFEDRSEQWRWRLRHRNGNVIADSGEGYAERNKVHDAIASVKKNAPGADVE